MRGFDDSRVLVGIAGVNFHVFGDIDPEFMKDDKSKVKNNDEDSRVKSEEDNQSEGEPSVRGQDELDSDDDADFEGTSDRMFGEDGKRKDGNPNEQIGREVLLSDGRISFQRMAKKWKADNSGSRQRS